MILVTFLATYKMSSLPWSVTACVLLALENRFVWSWFCVVKKSMLAMAVSWRAAITNFWLQDLCNYFIPMVTSPLVVGVKDWSHSTSLVWPILSSFISKWVYGSAACSDIKCAMKLTWSFPLFFWGRFCNCHQNGAFLLCLWNLWRSKCITLLMPKLMQIYSYNCIWYCLYFLLKFKVHTHDHNTAHRCYWAIVSERLAQGPYTVTSSVDAQIHTLCATRWAV